MDFTPIEIGKPDGPYYKKVFSEFLSIIRSTDSTKKSRARSWLSFVVGQYNKGAKGFPVDHQVVSLLSYLHARKACEGFQLKRRKTVAKEATATSSWGRVTACSSTEPVSTSGSGWASSVRPKKEESEESSDEESSDDLAVELADLARSLAVLSLKLHKKKKN